MRDIEVLVLDHSGVISNDFSNIADSFNKTLSFFGKKPVSDEEVRKEFSPSFQIHIQKYLPGIDLEVYDNKYFEFLRAQPKPKPFDNAVNAIKRLYSSGLILCVFSSHPSPLLISELEDFGVVDFFESIIGGVNKDNPDKMIDLISSYRVQKENIYYVGDTVIDAKLAKVAGISFYGIIGYHSREMLEKAGVPKDRIFPSLTELADSFLS